MRILVVDNENRFTEQIHMYMQTDDRFKDTVIPVLAYSFEEALQALNLFQDEVVVIACTATLHLFDGTDRTQLHARSAHALYKHVREWIPNAMFIFLTLLDNMEAFRHEMSGYVTFPHKNDSNWKSVDTFTSEYNSLDWLEEAIAASQS